MIVMRLFKNLPIKRKVMLVILLTCSLALLVATGALFAFEVINFRKTFKRDLAVLADIIANNSTAALAFKDKQAAEEILAALRARPHVLSATLQLPDGARFAGYGRAESAADLQAMPANGSVFKGRDLLQGQPVWLNGEVIGTLYLRSNYHQVFSELIRVYTLIFVVVLVASLLLAFLLSTRLQRFITEPILKLAATAKIIAEKKDYSVRAEKVEEDEMGFFTDEFNSMLAQIQAQDSALQTAQRQLAQQLEELNRSEERFRSLFENATIGLYRSSPQGDVLMANPTLLRLLGYQSLTEWTTAVLAGEPETHAGQREFFKQDGATQQEVHGLEFTWPRRDGAQVYVRKSAKPIRDASGAILHYEGTVEDITERRRAEIELERLNKQLIDTSRRAGMAEVATGVLHNVGNVLNSINVSATLIRENLRHSEIASLVKVASLIEQHAADLGTFLTTDPKGRLVPGFLIELAQHLGQEHAALQHEHGQLTRNVEHIKEIVAMQQSYARVSGVMEKVAIASLVDDAIRMNIAGLTRHGIEVVRNFSDVPLVTLDKHKVLQILVNLMHNAKYALDESERKDKKLTVGISLNGNHRVKVLVQDNGVGIPPENLTRVFSHGFTTRRGGHGFGLHSGANAAKEMGGTLKAYSEGLGRGATFTLELPVVAQTKN